MKSLSATFFAFVIILASCACKKGVKSTETGGETKPPPIIVPVASDVSFWLTKGDRSVLLEKQNVALNFINATNANATIEVDDSQVYQTIDGFGYTLTGGSATLINSLGTAEKDALIKELFGTDD